MAWVMHNACMKDFLQEIIDERTGSNPAFPRLVAEAEGRRRLARKLAVLREDRSLSQTLVAAKMGTSASVVSKLESGGDAKMSTFQRYCAAIGQTLKVGVQRRTPRRPVRRSA